MSKTKRASPEVALVRVAAVGDLHCTKSSRGMLEPLVSRMAASADVLVLCGDLTDQGLPEEARILAEELQAAGEKPVVAVLGNHDFGSDFQDEVAKILLDAGVKVLDGDSFEYKGVGFAGVKGFFGGFGERMLQAWGESLTRRVVHEVMEESLKLERALAQLDASQRIVLTHYAPIQGTVEGEPTVIFPFLGSGRLEAPLDRYTVKAAFHGHAHHGSPEGRTVGGVPVYNVSLPLLRRLHPDGAPFRVLNVKVNHA